MALLYCPKLKSALEACHQKYIKVFQGKILDCSLQLSVTDSSEEEFPEEERVFPLIGCPKFEQTTLMRTSLLYRR
jgi:hypothetical protein